MQEREDAQRPAYLWNVDYALPENFAFNPEVEAALPEVTKHMIEILGLPEFMEALVNQTEYAKLGDLKLKEFDLILLTNWFSKKLSAAGNRAFSDITSGQRQAALARVLKLDYILSNQTTKRLGNPRVLSEALEEIFGRIYKKTEWRTIYCLELYERVLRLSEENIQERYERPELTSDIREKPAQPFRKTVKRVLKGQEQPRVKDGSMPVEETDEEALQALIDEIAEATEDILDEPVPEKKPWKIRVPEIYGIVTKPNPDGDGWIAYATLLEKPDEPIEGTYAEHKKKSSASSYTKILLKKKIDEEE